MEKAQRLGNGAQNGTTFKDQCECFPSSESEEWPDVNEQEHKLQDGRRKQRERERRQK